MANLSYCSSTSTTPPSWRDSASDGGYYNEVVAFLKRLLTGPLKDGGEVLAFACLTGVQRISKESIFSDLNNLKVSTSLTTISDERFGFTEEEVAALLMWGKLRIWILPRSGTTGIGLAIGMCITLGVC